MSSAQSMAQGDSLGNDAVQSLQSRLGGTVFRPEDRGYDTARSVWNAMTDKRPAVIAQCTSTSDVASAVIFAREHGLPLSVRGGGHSEACHAIVNDGLVIDLSRMKDVQVDADKRIAYAQGGATWKDFDAATHEHGLATTGGIVSSVGVGGLTLGGGFGWLMRSCGMTCDNLVGAEVVTATGDVIHASESENSDLFWGLRGGGGNFGVVTTFELRLHPVHTVLGGMIAYPIERAREALLHYSEFTRTAPNELSVYGAMMTTPDRARIMAFPLCYAGDPEEGEKVIKPLKEWGDPIVSQVGPMPYPHLQQMLDEPNAPGLPRFFRGEVFARLEGQVIDHLVDHFDEAKSPLSAILLEHLGGIATHVPADATAYPHRDTSYSVVAIAQWSDPTEAEVNIDWAERTIDAIRPYNCGTYVNYIGDEGDERVRAAYGAATYSRLSALKAKYDPDNLFRSNQNVPPERIS